MTAQLDALRIDAGDPRRLARFWGGLLGWPTAGDALDGVVLASSDDTGFRLRFTASPEPKAGPNPAHLHLTSTSLADQAQTVATALGLGGQQIDIGQRPDEGHVVLADPEGNEFCVIEPGNAYLAGCGFLAEVTCDGSPATGHFWSAALGWPLVWERGLQTAIQAPRGGPKVSWDGAPDRLAGPGRLHLDLAPPAGGDQQSEAARLVALGARLVSAGPGEAGPVVLADPGGHEFRLLAPR